MFLLTLVEIYWFTLRAGISVVSNVTKDGGRGGGQGAQGFLEVGEGGLYFSWRFPTVNATNGYFLARIT